MWSIENKKVSLGTILLQQVKYLKLLHKSETVITGKIYVSQFYDTSDLAGSSMFSSNRLSLTVWQCHVSQCYSAMCHSITMLQWHVPQCHVSQCQILTVLQCHYVAAPCATVPLCCSAMCHSAMCLSAMCHSVTVSFVTVSQYHTYNSSKAWRSVQVCLSGYSKLTHYKNHTADYYGWIKYHLAVMTVYIMYRRSLPQYHE